MGQTELKIAVLGKVGTVWNKFHFEFLLLGCCEDSCWTCCQNETSLFYEGRTSNRSQTNSQKMARHVKWAIRSWKDRNKATKFWSKTSRMQAFKSEPVEPCWTYFIVKVFIVWIAPTSWSPSPQPNWWQPTSSCVANCWESLQKCSNSFCCEFITVFGGHTSFEIIWVWPLNSKGSWGKQLPFQILRSTKRKPK